MSLKGLELRGRRLLEPPLKRILAVGGPGRLPPSPERILVVRADNRLGNLVMLTSLLNALRERFPRASVSVLANRGFHSILEGQGWELIPVDRKAMARRPWMLRGLAARLGSMGFEAAIDASHPHGFSLSSAAAVALTGCPCRIGSPIGASPGWYTHCPSSMPGKEQHESRALHALGSVWPDWPRWSPPKLALPGGPGRRAVGIHPGAKPDKTFPVEFLEEVVRGCVPLAPVEVFWGNPGEEAVADALVLAGAVKAEPMGLKEFARRISGLAAFVCPDSGPMHVASAMGTPVVAMFRKEGAARFGPLSPRSVSVTGPDPEDVIRLAGELLR